MLNKNSRYKPGFWVLIAPFFVALSFLLLVVKDTTIIYIIQLLLGILLAVVIFRFPILGFGFIINSTIVVDLLPKTTFLSSILPLIGIVTIISYLMNEHYRKSIEWRLSAIEILGLVFIFWTILSNPSASLLGETRSWILTFIQLWLVLWMARQFIRSKEDHQAMMIILILGIIISAVVAIQQVGSLSNLSMENRAVGLSGGANTAARYFLYGIIILYYLQGENNKQIIKRLVQIFGILLLTIALFLTGSRSGLILFFIFIILQILPLFSKKQSSFLLIIVILSIIIVLIRQTNISTLQLSNVIDSIINGSDTVGYRYKLWEAGINIFWDHPLTGVGIGRFANYLQDYFPVDTSIIANTPHNTYIELLAETGIIGFLIFISFLVTSIYRYIKNITSKDKLFADINRTWLIVMIILLIGSFTKTDLVDKFLWFLLGINVDISKESISAHRLYK